MRMSKHDSHFLVILGTQDEPYLYKNMEVKNSIFLKKVRPIQYFVKLLLEPICYYSNVN